MPDRNPNEAYRMLLDALREKGLAWVAEQVQEQVRSGKPVTKDVSPYRETDSMIFATEGFVPGTSTRGPRQRLAATEEYSPEERVDLLIDALEAAVIHIADIEAELIDFFDSQVDGPAQIRFEADQFDDAPSLETERVAANRSEALQGLRSALLRMRREMGRDGHL